MVRTLKKKFGYWSKNTLDGEDILQKKKKIVIVVVDGEDTKKKLDIGVKILWMVRTFCKRKKKKRLS